MSEGTQRLKKAHRRSVILVVIATVILLAAFSVPVIRNHEENLRLQKEQAAYEASLEEAMKKEVAFRAGDTGRRYRTDDLVSDYIRTSGRSDRSYCSVLQTA